MISIILPNSTALLYGHITHSDYPAHKVIHVILTFESRTVLEETCLCSIQVILDTLFELVDQFGLVPFATSVEKKCSCFTLSMSLYSFKVPDMMMH